jgi:hypothetical protein
MIMNYQLTTSIGHSHMLRMLTVPAYNKHFNNYAIKFIIESSVNKVTWSNSRKFCLKFKINQDNLVRYLIKSNIQCYIYNQQIVFQSRALNPPKYIFKFVTEYYIYHITICNFIYKCFKYKQLKQYINYLVQHIYSNPRLPYMKYYIEHNLYDENNGKFKIGYINSKDQLIWYKL